MTGSFLVAIPAIAQRIVDDTNLPIHSAEILDIQLIVLCSAYVAGRTPHLLRLLNVILCFDL